MVYLLDGFACKYTRDGTWPKIRIELIFDSDVFIQPWQRHTVQIVLLNVDHKRSERLFHNT